MDFKECYLSDICKYKKEKIATKEIKREDYISTENMLADKQGIGSLSDVPKSGNIDRFENKDVLISNIRPYFKKIWLSDRNGGASPDVLVFQADQTKVIPEYLYYLLSQDDFFAYMVQTSKGTKMPRGDKNAIMQYKIMLFNNKEKQWKLVNILSSIDKKIQINKLIISNLEQLSQTLFKQWFIDFEFPNEEGKPYKSSGGEMVESELGEIPKGWVSSNISEVCLLNKGSYSKKDEWSFINYLDTSSITNNSISNIQLIDVQKEKVPSRAKRKLLPNDIVYSTVRPNQYHYGLIKNPLTNMVASTGFTVIRSKGKYPNDLIYMWLTQKEVTQHLQSVAEQSTSAYPSIKADDIGKIKILIPPKKLIDTLNDIISNNHNQIWGYQQENKKLSELRDTLLPKLLSGEIEIPDDLEM
ncbi:restriction endonuclease subunit S [Bacillus altitudinis]|uniref:restriction endonuclease subunit S n=1 Tax=Bacillus altitudinis TaxID=293387 RepID=UPI003D07D191